MQGLEVWLSPLPMPPSWNASKTVNRNRIVNTSVVKKFKKQFETWRVSRELALQGLTREIKKSMRGSRACLELSLWFCFPESSLVSKEGSIKALDVSNRIKMFEDQLSESIGIDDKYFQIGCVRKHFFKEGSAEPFVIARIRNSSVSSVCEIPGQDDKLLGLLPQGMRP